MLSRISALTYKIESHASKLGWLYRIANRYYRCVIEKETVLAGITNADHVLCIGGGMCPFSAILLHQATGANVTVIDNNSLCIPKARQVISRLNLDSRVEVLYRDGIDDDFDYSKYSVIHLALQVTPMHKVFSRVVKRALPGTRLLLRRPRKHLSSMYSQMFDNSLALRPYITHKSRNIGSTLLYTKQDELSEALV